MTVAPLACAAGRDGRGANLAEGDPGVMGSQSRLHREGGPDDARAHDATAPTPRYPIELPRLGRHFEFIGTRVFVPPSLLLFLAGAGMTALRWNVSHGWIAVSVALWLLSALGRALYLGPRARRAAQLFETEDPASIAGRRLTERLFFVSRLELVSFAIVIALMVFKPGA